MSIIVMIMNIPNNIIIMICWNKVDVIIHRIYRYKLGTMIVYIILSLEHSGLYNYPLGTMFMTMQHVNHIFIGHNNNPSQYFTIMMLYWYPMGNITNWNYHNHYDTTYIYIYYIYSHLIAVYCIALWWDYNGT